MKNFLDFLKYDPIPPLLASGDEALIYFTRRDLLGEDPGPVERLWELPGAAKILKKQAGGWQLAAAGREQAPGHQPRSDRDLAAVSLSN